MCCLGNNTLYENPTACPDFNSSVAAALRSEATRMSDGQNRHGLCNSPLQMPAVEQFDVP